MGFGLLFFGFFFLFNIPFHGVDVIADVFGGLLIMAALKQLAFYCQGNRSFAMAKRFSIVYTLFAAVQLILQLFSALSPLADGIPKELLTAFAIAYSIVIGAEMILIFSGIFQLANQLELVKIAARSRRMIAFTVVYYIIVFAGQASLLDIMLSQFDETGLIMSYINASAYLMGFIWQILSMVLAFNCYMRICLEGDEDMPKRETAFDRIIARISGKKKGDD